MPEPYREAEIREKHWDDILKKCPFCDICGCRVLPGETAFRYGNMTICSDCLSDYTHEFYIEEDE